MEDYKNNGVEISARTIQIGKDVTFGSNIKVNIRGDFKLGDYSHLGNCEIYGNNISFGKHLYCSGGLRVGGGGRNHPNANLTIGDRCTIHNNFLNVCEPIEIGDDVGLSPEVSILTHGYWLSVLEGNPTKFAGVMIGSGVIVGYRSLIMMGVLIAEGCVIGAQSVVTKTILNSGIYAGNPARLIRRVVRLQNREPVILSMLNKYRSVAEFHGFSPFITFEYPFVFVDNFRVM